MTTAESALLHEVHEDRRRYYTQRLLKLMTRYGKAILKADRAFRAWWNHQDEDLNRYTRWTETAMALRERCAALVRELV